MQGELTLARTKRGTREVLKEVGHKRKEHSLSLFLFDYNPSAI